MEMKILEYCLCIIEYSIMFFFLNTLLNKRYQTPILLILFILSGASLTYLLSDFSMGVKSAFSLAVLLLGSSILYRDKLLKKISYSSLMLFYLSIVDVIFGNLFALFMDEDFYGIFFANFNYRLITCLIIKFVDVLIFLFVKKSFRRVDENLKIKYWGLLSVVFATLLATTVVFLDFYSLIEQSKDIMMLFALISLAFFIMSIIIIYFFTETCAGFQRDKRLWALEINNNALTDALATQRINSDNLRKIKHDITKHTANAVALIESGKSDEAAILLRNAEEAVDKIAPHFNINTGNEVVDVIISSKASVCENWGITFTYKIEPLDAIKIEIVDLSSLLSNLLDNAIEAAQKTENGYIRIEIFKYKAYYRIYVENSFMGKSSILNSGLRLLSTKASDTMHGYGTQIIEEIARKYDGDSSWDAEGESFKSNVLLKI